MLFLCWRTCTDFPTYCLAYRIKSRFLSWAEKNLWSGTLHTSLASSLHTLTILNCLPKLAWLYHPSVLFLCMVFSARYVIYSVLVVCCLLWLIVSWACSQVVGSGCHHLKAFLGLENSLLWWLTTYLAS